MARAEEMVADGAKLGGPFQVRAAAAWKVVLPNCFAEEIRNNPNLDFKETQHIEFPTTLPGWEGMNEGLRHDRLFTDLVRIKLTQSLNYITEDMVDEADYALNLWMSEDESSWKTYNVRQVGFDVVARITSRVFAGKGLSRNEAYLRIAKENTATSFIAGYTLLQFPRFLWPFLNRVMPYCRTVRRQLNDATHLLRPSIEATIKQYEDGDIKKGPKSGNALGWLIEIQKGRPLELVSFVGAQLSLSMASIENTFKMLACCLIQCISHPEVIDPLRKEMVEILKENGWSKSSMQKMKLLDSFLKEVQRVDNFLAIMNRYVNKDTFLSDGTCIPAGAMLVVLDSGARDPDIYAEPEKFIADRYLRMREKPGSANRHYLVSTSSDNLGFGLGQHECPGRFFVAHELKMLMVFLLLRYDWRFKPGYQPPSTHLFEHNRVFPRNMELQARRRKEEIDLLDLRYS
ncbi:hypothetical protein HRS9122_03515 [Pyrenophora teres f. teres]|nr:hypothetical protein HRS9122_03515 [Pyrenophora teres f. teres]